MKHFFGASMGAFVRNFSIIYEKLCPCLQIFLVNQRFRIFFFLFAGRRLQHETLSDIFYEMERNLFFLNFLSQIEGGLSMKFAIAESLDAMSR